MYVVVNFDPWLFGSILLGLMLFLALLALVATLLYIVCYKRKDKYLVEEIPGVRVCLLLAGL